MRYILPAVLVAVAVVLAANLTQSCAGYAGPAERLGNQVMAGCE